VGAILELTTMEEFYDAVTRGEGYIVIGDTARPEPIAHPPGCPSVQAEHFKEKVIKNGGRSGSYYWVRTLADARERLGAVSCRCS
jgi:hypothetical protein